MFYWKIKVSLSPTRVLPGTRFNKEAFCWKITHRTLKQNKSHDQAI